MRDTNEPERRKRFFPTVSLGSVLAILTLLASAMGTWATLYADVSNNKVKIENIRNELGKKEFADREMRIELKSDVKEVKEDVKELNGKLDKVLFELRQQRR